MKKLYSLTYILIFTVCIGFTQTADQYSFSASSGSYSGVGGGTALNALEADDAFVQSIPIGFNFDFCGTTFTEVEASSNGWIAFGGTNVGASDITNDLSGTTFNRLAPLWDDLDGTGGVAKYRTTGTTPNQIFTVEFRNWEWNYAAAGAVISFQIKLYEADNHIEFIYDQEADAVNSASASIGIRDAAGNFLSLDGTGAAPTASSAVETTTLSAKPAADQVYSWTPPVMAPMAYTSCTTTQNNTNNVSANSISNEVIGMEIVTTGITSPLDATSFTFNTTGTTAAATDIANATLWSTGTSGTFATGTQVGAVEVSPNGAFTVTGTVTLAEGTNYFWLTYDVTAGATMGNIIDAECTSITVDGIGRTPTVTAPAGNRLIDYCENTNTVNTTFFIDDFSTTGGVTNITNNSSGFSANGYGDFTGMTVTQVQNSTVNFSITEQGGSMKFGIWVDWNQDGDFADAGEDVYANNTYNVTVAGNFTVPAGATVGSTRMRVLGKELGADDVDACTGTDFTECEDYTFVVNAAAPMAFASCTTTQNNVSDVNRNSSNKEVIGIEIVTTGTSSPIDATSFTFNTTGTTAPAADISNATLWSTGTSNTFGVTTQVGAIEAAPNGSFTITGTVTLSTGTNYFWLTYDVPAVATIGNFIDAECTSVTVDAIAHTPTVTAPAGDREIIDALTWDGTFESSVDFTGNGFTAVDDGTNWWVVGTATDNGGIRSAYVTNDGTANAYTNTVTNVSHFYFDYNFPASQSIISLDFDWICDGEGSLDNIKIFIEPTTETPTANTTNNGTYQVGSSFYSGSLVWVNESITLDGALAGTTKRIVFQWQNDGSVGAAPAAVDNIVINAAFPSIVPGCVENPLPADASTDLCLSTIMTWDAPITGDPTEGYYINFGTDNPPTNIENSTDLGNATSFIPTFLLANTTYFWQVVPYNYAGPATGCTVMSFTTNTTDVPNDLPCNAESIILGATASGDNNCASNTLEPATAACWTTGNENTVWYSFVAPASGEVDIITHEGTLEETQIALFSGDCTALVEEACNEDIADCGLSSYDISELNVVGLTAGDTYYVAVDGEFDLVGTFTITIADHAVGLPIIFGQDCGVDNAIPVCNSTFTVGDPGFQATGNYCDFDGNADCTGGERGSVWYHIQIGAAGVLDFTLVPNDWDGLNETDYDFLLYKVAGAGAVTCAEIQAGTGLPIRCNYDADGVTGLFSAAAGQAPALYTPAYDFAFEAEVNVVAGEEYFLVISNFSNSTSGFDLDLNTSPITVPGGSPASLTWTGGGNSSDWYNPLNWGDCAYYPDETIDANIIASSAWQPVIDAIDPNNSNNARAKNLTISPSATMTIDAGQTFELYGDYSNSGMLAANAASIFQPTGTATQVADGSMQAVSAFGNLTINKTAGEFRIDNDIEVATAFTTSNATSIFNTNNLHVKIGGDFTLNAPSTYTNFSTSGILEFDGTGAQTYDPNGSLVLHDVIVNNLGAGVSINNNLKISSTGTITFTEGIIHTSTRRVEVNNTSGSAISVGHTDSYIDGELRAYVDNNTETYNFPVGDLDQYALAMLENNNLVGVSYLDVNFYDTFNNTGAIDPVNAIDFGTPYTAIATEGIWEIIPNSQPTGGSYDIFLTHDDGAGYDGMGIPLGANAFLGLDDDQFGVLKRDHTSDLASDWYGDAIGTLNPNGGDGRLCMHSYASRYGISSFSDFAIGKLDAPMSVELVSFEAECFEGDALVSWTVASESNSRYYIVERSYDGKNFEEVSMLSATLGACPKTYEWKDSDYLSERSAYYRLSEVDFNDKESTFNVQSLNCEKNLNAGINARQISNRDMLVEVEIPEGTYDLFIYDNTGKLIINRSIDVKEMKQEFEFYNSSFLKGLYLVLVKDKQNSFTSKVIMK